MNQLLYWFLFLGGRDTWNKNIKEKVCHLCAIQAQRYARDEHLNLNITVSNFDTHSLHSYLFLYICIYTFI